MDRSQFVSLADNCLERVAEWLEEFDADEVDFETTDGVVTIEFADRTRYVLNRQAAASQMWFAAGARAWHYNWDGSAWLCDRDQHALLARIQEVLAAKLARKLSGLAE
ncbi:MAG: iron donor protein CyaY [Planctomycetes bacterium]|nr:iron donor protein CyaY [Planctomycetota bacterium]